MVQLAAGTVQLLLVDPPPQLAQVDSRTVSTKAGVKDAEIELPIEPMSRRRWLGAGLVGLGLVGVGGVAGWFLGRWSVRDGAGRGIPPRASTDQRNDADSDSR
jgi:hypothetical protein